MSSIRPLATITVLAAVGVFLYMKINETEPPLPAGVEDWSANTDIQFDMGEPGPGAGPGLDLSPAAGEAPTFSADPTSPASTSGDFAPPVGAGSASASAWSDPPASSAPPTGVASAPSFESVNSVDSQVSVESQNNLAARVDAPQLPDLPPLPPAASSGLEVNSGAQSTPPSATQDQPTLPALTTSAEPALAQPGFPPVSSTSVSTPAPSSTSPATGPVTPFTSSATAQAQSFSATRLAVHAALDRGELSQALLLLSDWYGDPSLSAGEATEVNTLLSQLAGSVIYSMEHRLEPPYMVQVGERLEMIAKKYDIPWQLLAKINGITSADQLQPGQQLKVVRGPFSALIDISQRRMTLMLDRRYAGRFSLSLDPGVTVEEGHWQVNQKLLTPANVSLPGATPSVPTEERSLMLSSTSGGATQVAILRGAAATNSLTDPAGRVLRLNPADAADVFDILSLGSKVVIRR